MTAAPRAQSAPATTDEAVATRRGPAPWAVPAVLAVVAVLGVLAVVSTAPPSARPADAPEREFSARRAIDVASVVAQRPHPTGSADNRRVREYIVDTARALGAEVRVESGEVIRPDWGNPFPAAVVHNVVATVRGTDPAISGGRSLLLVAHYDSVPTGPGAADDGAAVASMLETLRALRAGPALRNDVVLLFTDAEELGGLGATKFVQQHGVDGFGAVLNWEARGSRGPMLMFETSDGNGGLIDAYAAAARPVANSLAYEVYRRMPNDSDFTVFRDAGALGLNTAFIDGFHDYHSPHDDIAHLSADSVQHQGDTMLALVRRLGGTDLRDLRGSDAVYFDLFARVLVHYPAGWALPLAALTLLGLVVLLVVGVRRSALRVAPVAVVAGTGLGAVLASAVLSFALWQVVLLVRPGLAALPLAEPYPGRTYAAGFGLVVVAVLLVTGRVLRRHRPPELIGGVLALAAVLLLVTVVLVPGASYLLQWPLLAGLPALWWTVRRGGSWRTAGVWLCLPAPALAAVLFLPLVDSLLAALGVPLAAVAMAVAALAGLLLVPLLVPAHAPRPRWVEVTAGVLVLVVLATGVLRSGYDSDRPRPDSLMYVRDVADDRTVWFSGDPEPDAWTRKVLGADPERAPITVYWPQRGPDPQLTAPAPTVDLPPPTVRVVADTTAGDRRTVRFRVATARQAWRLQVRLPRADTHSCLVAGQRMDADALRTQGEGADGVVFQVFGAYDGIEFECDVTAGRGLPVDVADYTDGLPEPVAALVGPRPAGTVRASYGFAPDETSVVRVVHTI